MTLLEDWEEVVTEPVAPTLTDDQAAMLAWAAEHPVDRPAPEVSNGRYKLDDPTGASKAKTWTRVTTLTKALDDTTNLARWGERMLVAGILAAPGLLDEARALADPTGEDKATLNGICGRAGLIGGATVARDLGTAMHTATEHHDLGTGERPPAPWTADVDAYATALATHGITTRPDWVERVGICTEVGAAGTIDRIVTLPDGRNVILDLKTGSTIDYSHLSYACQLAVYAHCTHLWTAGGWDAMPTVDQAVGIIAHAPIGSGTCTLYQLDIAAGWDAARLAVEVRKTRNAARKWATVIEAPVPIDRTSWIVDRITNLKADHPDRVDALRDAWPILTVDGEPAPVPRQPPWDDRQIDAIDRALNAVEPDWPDPDPAVVAERRAKAAEAPEPAPAPEPPALWAIDDDGAIATDEDATALRAAIARLEGDHLDKVRAWVRDARDQGRPWTDGDTMTVRGWTIGRAALRCIAAWQNQGWTEPRTRAALAYVVGEELHPTWTTGAVLGLLTTDQATELANVVAAYQARDKTVKDVIDALTNAA